MRISDLVFLNEHKTPDAPALVFEGVETSFAQFAGAVRRLAGGLAASVGPGARVGVLSKNRPAFVEAYYGAPLAGCPLVFINYRLHPKEVVSICNHAQVEVLLAEDEYLSALEPHLDGFVSRPQLVCLDAERADARSYEQLLSAGGEESVTPLDESDPAWIIYTSGTTGAPKGVVLSHRNIMASVFSAALGALMAPGGVTLSPFPLCHIAGYAALVAHLRGGAFATMAVYDPEELMRIIERHRVTSLSIAPTMFNMLLQHPRIDDFDLSSLDRIGYGGSSMPVEVLREGICRFGSVFAQGFGMTELAGNVLQLDSEAHERAAKGEEHLLAAAGRPMVLAMVRCVDEQGRDVAPGEVGEILVKGDQVTTGYLDNPAANGGAFRQGWFHTGDLARVDEEGIYYIVDRAKDMIVSGGENVYSREVEDVIYEHPGVSEVAVIGLPDETWGEVVTAVVTRRSGAEVSEEEVVAACRDHLAGYKKPRRVFFVDELPKNPSGKLLKRELRDRFNAPS